MKNQKKEKNKINLFTTQQELIKMFYINNTDKIISKNIDRKHWTNISVGDIIQIGTINNQAFWGEIIKKPKYPRTRYNVNDEDLSYSIQIKALFDIEIINII